MEQKRAGGRGAGASAVVPSNKGGNVVVFPQAASAEVTDAREITRVDGRGGTTFETGGKRANAVQLTKAVVRKLIAGGVPAGKGEAFVWDKEMAGFGLRIRAGGGASWVAQFRDDGGATRRVKIGDAAIVGVDEARQQGRKVLAARVDRSKARREARSAARVGELVDGFLAYAAGRQRAKTLTGTKHYLRVHARGLHSLAVQAVGRADIARLHETVSEVSGAIAANRMLGTLSSFFVWCCGKGYRDDNPVAFVPKNAERARERVLTAAELRAIWLGTGTGSNFDRIIRLLMLTGCRRSEVGGMRWAELSGLGGSGALWTVPAERMKGGSPHVVPLVELALAQLPEKPFGSEGAVFGKDGSTGRGYAGWSRSKGRLDGRLRLAGGVVTPWGLHDFRRTLSTRLHDLGIAPHIVEAVLAHSQGGVAAVYNKAEFLAQKRQALELWAAEVGRVVGAGGDGAAGEAAEGEA